jgi:nitroreductase
VGHVGQNISLQAIALDLGTAMIGAFEDKGVKEVLGIRKEPLYIIPVGKI